MTKEGPAIMSTVYQLKQALYASGLEVFATVCVPASIANTAFAQPIIVPTTKSAMRQAIKHLPNKTQIPFAIDGNKVIVGSVN
jgi:hypothetical protein